MTSRTGSTRKILGILKKVRELSPASGEGGWLSLARGGLAAGAQEMGGADEKARIERMCISLPYVETFNSKVIKGFVPELRSLYVFFEIRDSFVRCIYMNILCTFHISVTWVWYMRALCFIFMRNQLGNTFYQIELITIHFCVHCYFYYFLTTSSTFLFFCPVDCGCRLHRLFLCSGVRPPQWVSWIWH